MNVEPNSTSKSTEVQTQKRKPEMNQFLFSVVNQFNLDEFKKYTNVRELVRNALEKHDPTRMDSLERYIELNFKQNLPVEKVWKKRGFARLLLTSDFYESETSERVFHNIFGIKKCKVFAGPIDDNKTEVDMSKAEEMDLDPDDKEKSEVIDLTTDEHHDSNDHIYPPKRRKKNKLIPKPTCLSEPSKTALLSDDVQPSKPKIGPKSRVKRDSSPDCRPQVLSNKQPSTFTSKTSKTSLRSDETQPPKPTVISKSRGRRDSSPDCVQQGLSNNQPSTCIPESSQTSLRSDKTQPPKPKVRPKSRVRRDSSPDCVQQGSSNNQPSTCIPEPSKTSLLSNDVQPSKPKIGPKSRVKRDNSPDCHPQVLSNNQPSTFTSKTSQTSLRSDKTQLIKQQIGPKSRVRRDSSPDCVQQGLSNNQPSTCIPEPSKTSLLSNDVQPSKPKIGPKSRIGRDISPDSVQQGLSNKQPSTCIPESSQTSVRSDKTQPSKPQIGPVSRVRRDSSPDCVQQCLSNNQPSTCIPESSQTLLQSDKTQLSKPKDGPKSRVKHETVSDCLPKHLSDNQPPICLPIPSQISLDFHSKMLSDNQVSTFLVKNSEKTNDDSLTPFNTRDSVSVESTANPVNPFSSMMKELPTNIIIDNPSDVVSISPTESLKDVCQLPSLNSFTQSFCTQLSSIENQFQKYLNITHPSNLSLKQFWLDFLILEYENGEPSDGALKSISNSGSDQEVSPTILNSNLNVSSTNTPKDNSMKTCDIEKEANICEEPNQKESSSSDVEIIETSNSVIDITNDCTQNLLNNLRVDHDETLEQFGFVGTFALPQCCSELVISSISIGCHNEKPLNITMEPLNNISAVSNDTVEKIVPNESQIQRYNLLNYDNSMFLSSQLANFELNAGKQRTIGPMTPQETAVKTTKDRFVHRQSCPTINLKPSKLKLHFEDQQYTSAQKSNVIHKLYWKILNVKAAVFQQLSMNTFNLELQLRNNFDKFHLNDQQSIKQLLDVNDSEWKHIVNVLKVLSEYTYDVSNPLTLQKSDLLHRIMNCFMKSIPLFVKSHLQFRDFMGNLLEVIQHQPLPNKCVNSTIDPSILKQMIEFKKKNENKVD